MNSSGSGGGGGGGLSFPAPTRVARPGSSRAPAAATPGGSPRPQQRSSHSTTTGGAPLSPRAKAAAEDIAVMQTNDDAAVCKLSGVRLGYWRDDFLHYFVRTPSRRPPLINRGYFTRVATIHGILRQFLAAGGSDLPKQVVCLGAGFDTTYFQKKSEGVLGDNVTFFELDFSDVVKRKCAIISSRRELHSMLGGEDGIRIADDGLHTKNYHLMMADLRSIDDVEKTLTSAGLDKSIPTIFLSECVLIYMKEEHSAAVVRWAATFNTAVFVTYEQILPDDAFGRMMLKNLQERNVHLHGLHARPDLETQRRAYLELNWDQVEVVDMNTASDRLLDREELARLNKIEMFDEVEEWRLMQAHYCVVLATKDASQSGLWSELRIGSK